MIKTFEQFINENYNETPVYTLCEEYGAPLFNEVSESLMYKINRGINEGRIVINASILEEGLFDTIGKLFKKGADKAGIKSAAAAENIDSIDAFIKKHTGVKDINGEDLLNGKDLSNLGSERTASENEKKVFNKIEELCKSAEDICAKLAEKEESMYKTIEEKMDAANKAIKEFTKNMIAKINEIVEVAEDKINAVVLAVLKFAQRVAAFAKKAAENVGKGIVFAFSLPFIFAFSVYKAALSACEMLAEKIKDGLKIVKDVFTKIKNAIVTWVSGMLAKAKDALIKGCEAVKKGAKDAYEAIANGFLTTVSVVGQLASDVKDAIKDAFDDFVAGAKEFADEVKNYIKDKWDAVTDWCKNTASAFSEGVKNVWNKMKEKVTAAVGAAKDAYNAIKDYAKETIDNINKWQDGKQRDFWKSGMKYAVNKWGKDEVSSWLDEL